MQAIAGTYNRIKVGIRWRLARLLYPAQKRWWERKWYARLAWDVRQKSREFRADPNYNLSLVDSGFADRNSEAVDDAKTLYRIIRSYNKAKAVQEKAGPSFKPSNEWLPIYEYNLGPVMQALKDGDLAQLGKTYRNFFRDPCSRGLHGMPLDMNRYYFGGRIAKTLKLYLLNDAVHRYQLWKSLLGKGADLNEVAAPDIGNPYGVYFDGVLVNCGFYQHYYAKVLSRLLRGTRKRVLELGGGHGGMAYFLIRDNPDVTYIDFDLPENAALTAYYLLRAFPNKRVLLFGEEEDLSASIIIMPSFAITELADKSVDVAFNSYSLAELSRETIDTFVSELTRLASEYILHVNHNRVSKVVADDFGIEGKFDLLYKIPALWNRDMDEYEYLYKAIKM